MMTVILGLVVSAIVYARAYIVSRLRLGLEAAVLRQQLVVFKRKHTRPSLRNIDRFSGSLSGRCGSRGPG